MSAEAFDEEAVDGPSAHGDPMGTPAQGEKVLWKGKPQLGVLARTAFHTRTVALYFVALIAISLTFGNANSAIVCTVLGIAALLVLQSLAWISRRTTVYILTDTRLIMRIGMALETRINVPLKQIGAAHLKQRGGGHGDITMELKGERLLGYLLLWPHVRPWKFAHPQPMLRAVPDAEKVAAMLAEACAKHAPIERTMAQATDTTSANAANAQQAPALDSGSMASGLKGAPA